MQVNGHRYLQTMYLFFWREQNVFRYLEILQISQSQRVTLFGNFQNKSPVHALYIRQYIIWYVHLLRKCSLYNETPAFQASNDRFQVDLQTQLEATNTLSKDCSLLFT